jgi:hypothetical protein
MSSCLLAFTKAEKSSVMTLDGKTFYFKVLLLLGRFRSTEYGWYLLSVIKFKGMGNECGRKEVMYGDKGTER